MLRPGKDATPATALTGVAPESVAPGAPVPAVIATVTLPINPVTVLSRASSAVTWTAGTMAEPAVTGPGGTVNASLLIAPVAMSNSPLVAAASVPLDAVRRYPLPLLLMERLLKVATPLTAGTVLVPLRTAPPVPVFVV